MGERIDIENLVEITLNSDEDFLKVKETLTRIGVASRKDRKLYQSCHILHKRGKYYIVHFKELFALDGLRSDFDDEDRGRRNAIVGLLSEWGLVNIVDINSCSEPITAMNKIKILKYSERDDWELCPKYHIGKSR
tara:strand:+ start:919 stop:1323 length:405 start_codon:yes stop_codon:yes gene_type:complete